MMYDLKNIGSLIVHKPLYIIILFLMAYVFFYISFAFNQNWYVSLFSIFGWLSIISIVALVIADILLFLIKITDELPDGWRLLPYLTIPISYVLARTIFFFFPNDFSNSISLLVMIFSTVAVTFLLLYYKTNKFKTKTKMKQMKVEDGPRRIIKK